VRYACLQTQTDTLIKTFSKHSQETGVLTTALNIGESLTQ